MATDMAKFLRKKFFKVLEETEKSSAVGLVSHFKRFKLDIENAFQKIETCSSFASKFCPTCSSFASKICPLLYDLNHEIAELQIFAQQRMALSKNLMRFVTNVFVTNVYFKPKMNKRLEEIKRNFQEIMEEATSPHQSSPTAQRTVAEDNAPENFGFKNRKEIEDLLLQEESNQGGLKAIGISGMGGSGKTALAREVFNSPRVTSHFSKRIWVCLSDIRSVEQDVAMNIVKFILEEVGYDVDQLTTNPSMAELLKELNRRLSNKRYLIVFDNVWVIPDSYANLPQKEGGQFSQALPKGCGGAVMVTSRIKQVAKSMVGEENLFHVQPLLNQKDCWTIFESTLHLHTSTPLSENDEEKLTKCKNEIITQCHGLPLVAKMLARIISKRIGK